MLEILYIQLSREGKEMIKRKLDDNYESLQNERSGLDFDSNEIHKAFASIERHFPNIKTVLDIGCRGHASTVKYFHDLGKDSYGIDIGTNAESQWDKADFIFRNNLRRWDIHKGIPFDVKFDLISISHVLEHLHTPDDAIKHIAESLSKGGVVWSIVPLEENLEHRYHYNVFTTHSDHIDIWQLNGFDVFWGKQGFNGQPCSYLICRYDD